MKCTCGEALIWVERLKAFYCAATLAKYRILYGGGL